VVTSIEECGGKGKKGGKIEKGAQWLEPPLIKGELNNMLKRRGGGFGRGEAQKRSMVRKRVGGGGGMVGGVAGYYKKQMG